MIVDKYWVSYAILDSGTGATAGSGSVEIDLAGPPEGVNEVVRLADLITEHSHERATIPRGHHVAVLSWSKFGGGLT